MKEAQALGATGSGGGGGPRASRSSAPSLPASALSQQLYTNRLPPQPSKWKGTSTVC